MKIREIRNHLSELYKQQYGNNPEDVMELPLSGSNRRYFRLSTGDNSVIGTYNNDINENAAFFYLADHLKSVGVKVPEVYAINKEIGVYLQEDLGDGNLYDMITENENAPEGYIFSLYKKVIDQMPALQYKAAKGMDFSVCYPREAFDRQSIQWDLNYFKYNFLKLAQQSFSEQELEDEFNLLIDFLLEAPSDYFLFRDFQSRNIMLKDEEVCFIDFQGGRKGALQYDLASLLFESKTNLSPKLREDILNYYLEVFSREDFFDKNEFLKYFHAFVLVRLLQAFGAYGYRGLFEKKAFFVKSIAPGLVNLLWLTEQTEVKKRFPYICKLIQEMQVLKDRFKVAESKEKLTVTITSFSYKKGLPEDWSGNGGGFVFDCRFLPNPGRLEEYRSLTGRDKPVIEYLNKEQAVHTFIDKTESVAVDAIKTYIDRGFTNLSIAYGCTGGQHRSVYSAQSLFNALKMNFDINLRLIHREQNIEEFYGEEHVQKG